MRAVPVLLLLSLVACASSPASTKPKGNTNTNPTDPGNDYDYGNDDDYDNTPYNGGNQNQNQTGSINLRWNGMNDFVYSLDVKTAGGDWIGPCLDKTIVGSRTTLSYEGTCRSASDRSAPNPVAYRLFFSRASRPGVTEHWQDFVEATPSSAGGEVMFPDPQAAQRVDLSWDSRGANVEYSLDVFLENEQIRPCINQQSIQRNTRLSFDGICTAPPHNFRQINLREVRDFVVCYAEAGTWHIPGAAKCAGIPYTGFGRERKIPWPAF